MGWAGSMAEIARAWREDPKRVRAWLAYARRRGLGAGWLRKTLREEPGYPPVEPVRATDDPHRYRDGPLAAFFADEETDGDALPPDVGPTFPAYSPDPDMGAAPDASPADDTGASTPPISGDNPPVQPEPTPDMGAGSPETPSGEARHPPPPLPPEVRHWWDVALGQLLGAGLSKADFNAWVRPARPLGWVQEDGHAVLTVAVANEFARRWLEERVGRMLSRSLGGLSGQPVEVRFVVA